MRMTVFVGRTTTNGEDTYRALFRLTIPRAHSHSSHDLFSPEDRTVVAHVPLVASTYFVEQVITTHGYLLANAEVAACVPVCLCACVPVCLCVCVTA
jgi:hypothetical protein